MVSERLDRRLLIAGQTVAFMVALLAAITLLQDGHFFLGVFVVFSPVLTILLALNRTVNG